MSPRASLLILSFANFVVGMGAFVVIGVLTPVAQAFAIDQATAGWTRTAYAPVYGVAWPVLVALTGAVDRRAILGTGFVLFLAGSALAAAPRFAILLGARAVMALGRGW